MGRVSLCSSFIVKVAPTDKFCEKCLCQYILCRPCSPDEASQCALVKRCLNSEPQVSLCTTSVQGYLVYWGSLLSHAPFLSLTIPDPWTGTECQVTLVSAAQQQNSQRGPLSPVKPWNLGPSVASRHWQIGCQEKQVNEPMYIYIHSV